MPELRWILLGLGILFFIGLWWWEARRGRQAADSSASLNPVDSFTSTSTTVVRDAPARPDPPAALERELAPWNEPAEDEAQPPWSDPVEDEVQAHAVHEFEMPAEEPEGESMIDIAATHRPVRIVQPARIEPTVGDAAAAVGSVSRAASEPPVEERIVTVRVAAPPLERFEGRRLVGALRAAGLEYGKFSIFHKPAADGSTRFSVASLVEPGTFDLEAIEGRRFPGVSLFVVLRAGGEALALDDMLGTARGLASSLHGTVQDERGAPLSPQRLAELRAEITAWQGAAAHGA